MLDWKPPHAKWFVGGKINVCDNCLDRHLAAPRAATRPPSSGRASRAIARTLTYWRAAPRGLQVRQRAEDAGHQARATASRIYMPMMPELAIAMLACARIGAVHSVVFGGFAPKSLPTATTTPQAKLLITADGGWRRGADRAAASRTSTTPWQSRPSVEHVRRRRAAPDAKPVDDEGRPRPLVARPDGRAPRPTAPPSRWTARTRCSSSTPAARPASRRASCTPPPATCVGTYADDQVGLRPQGRRRLLVHGRHRLGHRPQLRRLRPARRTAPPSVMYEGAPDWPAARTASGRSSRSYRVTIFYTAPDGDPRVHQVGRPVARPSTTSRACGCSARSASRSIPKPGCGTSK